MADVTLSVGGRSYRLSCRDGEEAALKAAAGLVDARCRDLGAALGAMTESRLLLMAALMLAGEHQDAAGGTPAAPTAAAVDTALAPLIERTRALAARLERAAGSA